MSRKSKAKFNMKGHSFPGIKGFKDTSLEDGRAASSAFQMKESPLIEEKQERDIEKEKLEFDDPTKGLDLSGGLSESRTKLPGESGPTFLQRQAQLLAKRWKEKRKAKKDKEENPSKVLDEKTEEYAEFGTDPRDKSEFPEHYDEHGNYKPDYPELYPDFELTPTLSSEGTMESLIEDLPEDHPGRVGEVDPEYDPGYKILDPTEKTDDPNAPIEESEEAETTKDYSGSSKNEMYDLRRPFKDDGTWNPNNNPEHANIQNRINELHGVDKRYPTE